MVKQICGYCLEEVKGEGHCPCDPHMKKTFFSDEIDFTVNEIDKPICECGCDNFIYKAHYKQGQRQTLAFNCANCEGYLGAETYFPHGNPKGVDYIDLLKEEENEFREEH